MDIQAKLRKELRFVTSAEQMIPFLNRISATNNENNDSDDQNGSDTNESVDPSNENTKINKKRTTTLVQPGVTAVATSECLILPNIYEEYVNFIDLSVLNPIIDATNCQPDVLTESEISELRIIFFLSFAILLCVVYRISDWLNKSNFYGKSFWVLKCWRDLQPEEINVSLYLFCIFHEFQLNWQVFNKRSTETNENRKKMLSMNQ